jgi:hypothetical protein
MSIRKLAFVAVLLLAPARAARAEVGIGAFIGEPTGLDLLLGLGHRNDLDILFGWYSHWDNRDRINDGAYAHLTYLVTPVVSSGESVVVPLRFGIGGAVYDNAGTFDQDVHLAVRVPLEVALRFRHSPLEIYGEVALKLTIINPDNHPFADLDGGVGIRFFF